MRGGIALALLPLVASVLLLPADLRGQPARAPAAQSQGALEIGGFGQTGPNDRRPLDIAAENGIEWQQNTQVYIARGNARATRGNATVYADVLIAHYRPTNPTPAANAPPPAGGSGNAEGSTEIYRVEADGNVRLATETQTVFGDHAIYDLDRATAVVTGKHLRLVTPRDTVTARDTLEWYDQKQVAVARGDAVAVQPAEGKRLAGDVLTALVVKEPNGESRITRIDAQGHVVVATVTDVARGASGVYNVDTGIATLAGGVTITRGDNEFRGQYGVVDLNRNVSRLLSAPPGAEGAAPVQGLVMPRQRQVKQGGAGAPPQPGAAGKATGTP